MEGAFVNLTPENLDQEHLCCIIRSKKPHPGVEAKRQWLSDRLKEGHVFRKLDAKATVFIEYAPLETAWVPVLGDNYLCIYCLWVLGGEKGKGYGRALMEYCLSDARAKGRSGVCMLGAASRRPGSPTSLSPKNSDLRRRTPPTTAIPCWPGPLTGRPPGLRPRSRSQGWRGRS